MFSFIRERGQHNLGEILLHTGERVPVEVVWAMAGTVGDFTVVSENPLLRISDKEVDEYKTTFVVSADEYATGYLELTVGNSEGFIFGADLLVRVRGR